MAVICATFHCDHWHDRHQTHDFPTECQTEARSYHFAVKLLKTTCFDGIWQFFVRNGRLVVCTFPQLSNKKSFQAYSARRVEWGDKSRVDSIRFAFVVSRHVRRNRPSHLTRCAACMFFWAAEQRCLHQLACFYVYSGRFYSSFLQGEWAAQAHFHISNSHLELTSLPAKSLGSLT